MILHCVFCDFRSEVSEGEQNSVLADLAAFSATLDGVERFDFGPNRDFEQKSQNYNSGFVIRFRDQAVLEAYAAHPRHKELGSQLVELCNGGAEGILVFDLEIRGP